MALAVESAGRLGEDLTASAIAELCAEHEVEILGSRPGADDKEQRKAIGSTMARIFRDARTAPSQEEAVASQEIEIDRFRVNRTECQATREGGGDYLAKYYRFILHE